MAKAYRLDGMLWIRAQFGFPVDATDGYAVQIGTTSFSIGKVWRNNDLLQLPDFEFQIEQILLYVGTDLPVLVVTDRDSGAVKFAEELTFHPSFFMPFFDFVRNAQMPGLPMGTYHRPERLAVFTHVHNDEDSLKIWERHYARFVQHRHLYVIDQGSDRRPSSVLHPETQVVSIPRGPVDHVNISQFRGYFQRFLLGQYRWVIHVECDELLIHEHGLAAFLARLDADDYGPIVKAGNAARLLDHTGGTEPLDLDQPMSLQRHVLNGAPDFRKPILAREATSWSKNCQFAFEHNRIVEDPALWLLHVRYADLRLAAGREDSGSDAPRDQTLEKLRDKVARLFSDDRSEMPDWMRGMF